MGFINNEKHVKRMLFRFVELLFSTLADSASDSAYFDTKLSAWSSKSTECDK